MCDIPPWVIASKDYNQHPQPLTIQGTSHIRKKLFAELNLLHHPEERGSRFHDYMDVQFQLHQWQRESSRSSQKSLKNCYLRFLRGWLFDSNSIEGAVLKGWVESRLGLIPTFHHCPIRNIESEEYYRYMVDRMKGSSRTSAILSQLDLLYEYVQYELRRQMPGKRFLTLFRGVNDLEEHSIIDTLGKNHFIIRLNNLNSFTTDFEKAWEFGSRVLRVEVPLTKIFFLSGLLSKSLFKGEDEYMVIGGDFEVKSMIGG
ncbi:NAD+---dinitrogen-reductase ADP-D-ribosyltransferase [Desulfuromusa kysingii]|uniref:NAD+---dinitrogen-reductase ADP-D-ribosyltransferase n=1 Tax=Desulfuromusa kysingii TaxID=37625 RepID=A0A1H4DJM6_9BACT|nr:NAD(+)--dinitrogen-reductase ADP-D-ribosyltransferase [Desulfuromusa kysingii]SEA72738.1 NAD+---dinitrogen-reductase ADP-D-ribosyltransferase [Desulfuromusa kysingii]